MPGTTRFGELKKSVGNVSQKVLTAQLRAMEKSGLVHREVYAEVPPRVEYSLTELGKSLKPILDSMWAWAKHTRQNSKKSEAALQIVLLRFLLSYIIPKCCNASVIAFSFSGGHRGCLVPSFLGRLSFRPTASPHFRFT